MIGKHIIIIQDDNILEIEKSVWEEDTKTLKIYVKKNSSVVYTYNDAKLIIDNDKFVILSGSKVRKDTVESCAKSYKEKRERLITDGFIKDNIVVKDIICTSLSQAACIVSGNSVNGKNVWKNRDGKKIEELKINSTKDIVVQTDI
jgi:hypothetical protein